MIIWGTKYLDGVVQEGDFFCPGCQQRRRYQLMKKRRWGHVYWIPLIPGDYVATWVACQECEVEYNEEVLGYDPEKQKLEFETLYQYKMNVVASRFLKCENEPDDERAASYMRLAQAWNLDSSQVEPRDLDKPFQELLSDVVDRVSDKGKEALLSIAALIAYSGGNITENSWKLLCELGYAMHMTEAHFKGTLNTVLSSDNSREKVH